MKRFIAIDSSVHMYYSICRECDNYLWNDVCKDLINAGEMKQCVQDSRIMGAHRSDRKQKIEELRRNYNSPERISQEDQLARCTAITCYENAIRKCMKVNSMVCYQEELFVQRPAE